MGTPNREPQDCSRNRIEYKDPGGYIPIIFLLYSWGFPVWGSQYSPSISYSEGDALPTDNQVCNLHAFLHPRFRV